MKDKIKVLIAEDVEPIRKRYVNVLCLDSEIEVIADVASGAEASKIAEQEIPDVILMDIEMETKDAGIRAAGNILSKFPWIKIIILTVYEEDDFVFSAFQLGVCDYILKNAGNAEIVSAVKAAHLGQSPIRPEIAGKIRQEFQRVKTYESSFLYMLNILSSLSPMELDTLYLLSSGKTRKEICQIRHVELSTIKSQINSILKKFQKKSIGEIITTQTDFDLLKNIVTNLMHRPEQGL